MRLLAITGLLVLALVALVMMLGGGSEEVKPASAARPQGSGPEAHEAPVGPAPRTAPVAASTIDANESTREATVLPARVLGEVVGELPARAYVVAEDAGGPRRIELQGNRFELETSALGVLSLRLEGIPRCVSEPVELDIARLGADYTATLTVAPLPWLAIRFVDERGKTISTLTRRTPPTASEPLVAIATREPPGSPAQLVRLGDDEVRSELGTYSAGKLSVDVPLPVVVSAVLGREVLASRTVHDATQVVEFRLDDAALEALRMRVRGRLVRAEDGTPIADTRALALARERTPDNQWVLASTDSEGRFDFDDLPRIPWFLVVDIDGRELVQIQLDSSSNVVDLGDVPVPESVALHGFAVNPEGTPLRAPRVWVGTVETGARDRAHHGRRGGGLEREDGWFSIFQLPRTPLVLGMWPEPDRAARSVVVDGSSGGLLEVQLVLVEGVEVSIACSEPEGVELLDERGFLIWSFADAPVLECRLAPGDYLLTDGQRSQGLSLVQEPVRIQW